MNLVLTGTGCLVLCAVLYYVVMPRPGKPDTAWNRTEGRGVAAALLLIILLVGGVTLIVKASLQ